jgi:PAS domain S-box-containing protein
MTAVSREKLLNALINIGQDLASTVDLRELLDRILQVSRDIFGFENAIIRLLDAEGATLSTVASYGYPAEVTTPALPVDQGIMGRVARSRQPLLINDLRSVVDYFPGIAGARSELAVPMLVHDQLIGVFNVESPRPDAFSSTDIEPLLALAGQAAIAIENARLYDKLRQGSERYQRLHHLNERILNSASLGIYALDADLIITAWNRRMAEISGVSGETAVGRQLFNLFPALRDEDFDERLQRVLTTGHSEKLQLSHRDLSGTTRFEKRRITPLKEADETIGIVVIVEDITEFRQLLDQTVHMEKLAEVGRLTAALAHEVNSPLAIIAYAAQLLAREEPLSDFQQEIIARIAGETERLKGLTGSLLSFSRPQDENFVAIDLNELLADILRLLRFEILRHSIKLREDYGEIPLVEADANRLKQVLINLVMNAVQAMGTKGTLTLTTRTHAEDYAEILLHDSGPGIPAELRERIFDPFFTTKADGEGTGLGLYVCRHIILEHQGTIEIDSSSESGTTVKVTLPAKRLNKY